MLTSVMKLVLQLRCSGIGIGRGTFVDINGHDMLLISGEVCARVVDCGNIDGHRQTW